MTLAEILQPKLADWRPAGEGRHSWSEQFPEHGWTVTVAADRTDSLGCLVWELSLTRTAEPLNESLRTRTAAIASRISGLMEPLTLHEVDDARGEAILRSARPTKKSTSLQYYEVKLLGSNDAILRRYEVAATAGAQREQIPFALTHEVLSKVAGDLAE